MYSRSLEKYKRLEKLQKVDNIFIWEVWKNSIKISFEICTKGQVIIEQRELAWGKKNNPGKGKIMDLAMQPENAWSATEGQWVVTGVKWGVILEQRGPGPPTLPALFTLLLEGELPNQRLHFQDSLGTEAEVMGYFETSCVSYVLILKVTLKTSYCSWHSLGQFGVCMTEQSRAPPTFPLPPSVGTLTHTQVHKKNTLRCFQPLRYWVFLRKLEFTLNNVVVKRERQCQPIFF